MAYIKPQVLVSQEFSIVNNEITDPLRAHISGPNAMLHRFDDADEKALINVGFYDKDNDVAIPYPDREAGSLVDQDSVKLFIENALLLYFDDLIGDTSNGRGLVEPVSGRKNWIRSTTVNFRANGTDYPRSALLNDRDVAVGDRVHVRGVFNPEDDCEEHELWTYVDGFAADEVAGTILECTPDTNNQENTEASTSIEQTDGANNCVSATADGAAYDGLEDGHVSETYTIEVIKSGVSGCQAARLRVTSDSGTDNQDEVEPADFGSPTDIGTRGLQVTFSIDEGDCSLSASSAGVESEELVVGQKWEVSVTQEFEKTCCEEGTTYTGPDDDTYIIEVTKGGVWADLPEITVTTVKGLDSSGPTTVLSDNTFYPVGTHGLTIRFVDCFGSSSSSGSALGDSAVAGLRKGDKFYITVGSGQNGPIRTLILRDDLPTELQDVSDMDLRLFIEKDIEVTRDRISHPPLVNYELESTQIVTKAGITAFDTTWTDNGVELPMSVWDGMDQSLSNPSTFGTMYLEYREWLNSLTDEVNFIADVADIDTIPGQLDEMNPLKWGVFRALQNSSGTRVAYTAVADPDDLDSWRTVLERIDGRDDLYNLVPLTYDREVWNLFEAHVESESAPEAGNWKGMVINLQAKSEKMVVGKSAADEQALNPTSTDGNVVLATLSDNPEATGTQFTLLSVPAGNSGFITHGVSPGDVVRYLFTIDAFGETDYQEFTVDRVLSQNSLLLLSEHTDPISVAQKVEIWHTLNKNEMVADLVDQAQSFANRRVVATYPDRVGTGGNSQEGYFLAAAIAGLASGVVPHQPLTNVEISGFDDLSSRTKDFFSDSQLDDLAEGGIWIATEDRDGTPHTRHALTTSTLDLNRRSEMIRRNVDSISYLFLRRLRPFIGRTNATPSMLRKLETEVNKAIRFLRGSGFTAELGSQLISGDIALNDRGEKQIYIHPLAADRVVIVINLSVPAPLNNIELNLII